jgi:hypothetical protein
MTSLGVGQSHLRRRVLGEAHPVTLHLAHKLAAALTNQGKHDSPTAWTLER